MITTPAHQLMDNLTLIQQRIAEVCSRVNRNVKDVTLICVSKTVLADQIAAAFDCGARHFGENYAQHLRDKRQQLSQLDELKWHFIGPVQRNKVKYTVGNSELIHTVASPALIEAIDQHAERQGTRQAVLIQLNLAKEATKSGISAAQLPELLDHFAGCGYTECVGLMTMPPFFNDPESARPYFKQLRQLREHVSKQKRKNVDLRHLSMGMSGDFEVAIEEGATLVRVGTRIFGPRHY